MVGKACGSLGGYRLVLDAWPTGPMGAMVEGRATRVSGGRPWRTPRESSFHT